MYIFKHVTVSGVYIAMFIKYVQLLPRTAELLAVFDSEQRVHFQFSAVLPSAVLSGRSRLLSHSVGRIPPPRAR